MRGHFLVVFTGLPVLPAVASIRCWRVDTRPFHVPEGMALSVESYPDRNSRGGRRP